MAVSYLLFLDLAIVISLSIDSIVIASPITTLEYLVVVVVAVTVERMQINNNNYDTVLVALALRRLRSCVVECR